MGIKKRRILIGLVVVLAVILISCTKQQGDKVTEKVTEKGFLQGKVVIGPICPVERVQPGTGCQPTEETYKAWPIAVYTTDRKTIIALIEPDLDGTYKIELPAGDYVVDLQKQHMFGSNLPATVTIKKEETAILNIDIDTGIR